MADGSLWGTSLSVLGGVGLFLLGMRLMTEGLKAAAGGALRRVLESSTRTRWRGLASGIGITSLVQSSSAVTIAAIGFVNAGLLGLGGAVAVLYGANVGTTTTGWLVAGLGVHLDVKAFALPLVGTGMALGLLARGRRAGGAGEALAGFGVFFLGVSVLKAAFAGLGEGLQLGALVGEGPLRALLFVGLGFLLTLLTQSSSAAIALVLTAVSQAVVPVGTGAALVIGANVGTTSTAALAVVGATANARRVAAAHLVFNALTGIVALALLPVLLHGLSEVQTALRLDAQPAASVAAFHTLFNLLGVALLWPLTGRLVAWLSTLFTTPEEDEARPRFLDRNVQSTPHLACHALVLELCRVGAVARRMAGGALAPVRRSPAALAADREVLDRLVEAVGEFSAGIQRRALPAPLEEHLPAALRVARYYSEIAELSAQVAAGRDRLPPLGHPELAKRVEAFETGVAELLGAAALEREDYRAQDGAARLSAVEGDYRQLKAELLQAGTRGEVGVRVLVDWLDLLSNVRRLAEQAERGARHLAGLAEAVQEDRAPPPPDEAAGSEAA